MHYVSTRQAAPGATLSTAIACGLAGDGGLYVPTAVPSFTAQELHGITTLSAMAQHLLRPYFAGDILLQHLPAICNEAFNFPAPLQTIANATYVLELFHGETAAFKDFGARFLAACMRRVNEGNTQPLTILVATSGDTGSAVAAAFHQLPGFRVVILYPDGRVSPRQAHQLGCFGGNITALRVAGSFDECQSLVKQAFNDADLRSAVRLSSANSISIGRWLPQMVYYATAALDHYRAHHTKLNFVIPTGNLGNAMACVLARASGLPIDSIVLANNANHVLTDFFATGNYKPHPSITTLANAMDVGNPSNFERLRWLYPDDLELRKALSAHSVDDDAIRITIREGEARYGRTWCPHTATAVHVLEQLRSHDKTKPWAIVATAHPAKFEQTVEPLVGHPIAIPATLAALLRRAAVTEPMPADYTALRNRLRQQNG